MNYDLHEPELHLAGNAESIAEVLDTGVFVDLPGEKQNDFTRWRLCFSHVRPTHP